MLTARKSVSAADVKKFERFRQSIKVRINSDFELVCPL